MAKYWSRSTGGGGARVGLTSRADRTGRQPPSGAWPPRPDSSLLSIVASPGTNRTVSRSPSIPSCRCSAGSCGRSAARRWPHGSPGPACRSSGTRGIVCPRPPSAGTCDASSRPMGGRSRMGHSPSPSAAMTHPRTPGKVSSSGEPLPLRKGSMNDIRGRVTGPKRGFSDPSSEGRRGHGLVSPGVAGLSGFSASGFPRRL